jgi:hypothetical protein
MDKTLAQWALDLLVVEVVMKRGRSWIGMRSSELLKG